MNNEHLSREAEFNTFILCLNCHDQSVWLLVCHRFITLWLIWC